MNLLYITNAPLKGAFVIIQELVCYNSLTICKELTKPMY